MYLIINKHFTKTGSWYLLNWYLPIENLLRVGYDVKSTSRILRRLARIIMLRFRLYRFPANELCVFTEFSVEVRIRLKPYSALH